MTTNEIVEKFKSNPKYLRNGAGYLANKWQCTPEQIYEAKNIARDTKQEVDINTERHKALLEECAEKGVPVDDVKFYWYKSEKFSLKVDNTTKVTSLLDTVEAIVNDYVTKPLRKIEKNQVISDKAVKATVTDMHVGLEPNPDGRSLFNYKYNAEIFNSNLDKVYNSILKEYLTHGKFDLLILDDLGDGLDGWSGLTTRGGHTLDQNMGNVESFKVYVQGKLRLIENLIEADLANRIKVRNVSKCNHSGDFGYIANAAIQMLLERTYDKSVIDFYILDKFMEHFTYGDHTFILTHGKDDKNMFKGLPLELNDKTITFINDYIDHYEIKSKYIHVEKGDLHRINYNRTKKFDYRNFMSFAPPSAYVQHNFGISYSGYSVQVVPKHLNEISHTDYFFEFERG